MERIFLNNNTGNVGVNTNSPTEILDVNGSARIREVLQIQPSGTVLVELQEGGVGEGVIGINGPNGNRNAVITQPGGNPNYGFFGVHNENGFASGRR